MAFQYQTYPFKKPPELCGSKPKIYDVVIVGAGPVGLTMALALAKQGVKCVLLDDSNQVSVGSRAICFSKQSLEIFDKLCVAKPMIEKGVQWNVGRIFFREKEIDRFDLSPEKLSKYPAFINLQQYYVEHFLIDAVLKEENIDVRWLNKVVNVKQLSKSFKLLESLVEVEIETPEGNYSLKSKYVVACDGSRSPIRNLLNLEMHGERFEEHFLIADFRMSKGNPTEEADFPSERWFWFDPPFARGQSILLHKQPDNLWRLDFKLGKHVDSSIANNHDFIKEKIRSVVGERPFELDWTSIYSFSSKMLDRFVHGNIVFVGDSAHVVSPFGARGANSGIADANNLSWKLAEILRGGTISDLGFQISETDGKTQNILRGGNTALLETYNAERTAAAIQNIACTGETNTFIAPPSEAATTLRNEILIKARTDSIYKKQINCGRLSVPNVYGKYPNSEEGTWKNADLEAGKAIKDCDLDDNMEHPDKIGKTYLIEKLKYQFTLLILRDRLNEKDRDLLKKNNIKVLAINYRKNTALMTLYELGIDTAYLITPDQYVLGRWKDFDINKAIDLKKIYLSGAVYDNTTLQKTEQERIDEEVAKQLRSLS